MEMKERDQWNKALDEISGGRDISLGKYYSWGIDHDIKHLGFIFSRYKFASKMIENRKDASVLELGCSYGLGAPFFLQTRAVRKYCGVDLDQEAIQYAQDTFGTETTSFVNEDFLGNDYRKFSDGDGFNAVISIDVIEHIFQERELDFLDTICVNLKDDGFALIGTPNIAMKQYGSPASNAGHVNMYDQKRLYTLMNQRFDNVFVFGMNDEVIHTGFYPFSCYIFALCTNKRVSV